MPTWALLTAGFVVSVLCVAFLVVTLRELRHQGKLHHPKEEVTVGSWTVAGPETPERTERTEG